jgi:mannitol/fructose-specific phosphotransferase system IIA component (Ntr-type)
MIRISELIGERMVLLDLDVSDRSEVFRRMVCTAADCSCLPAGHEDDLCSRLDDRELIGSTYVGRGVALPHAYFEQVEKPMIVFARLVKPIAFAPENPENVNKVFMLVGPKRNDTEHLMILARLAHLLRDVSFLESLDNAESPADLLVAVADAEKRH